MKVLVTGGAGYIGSVCVEALCTAGHEVIVVDNLCEGHRSAVDPRARLEVADLADREAILGLVGGFRPEAIVHFAAFALVGESMTDPSKYFRNNVSAGIHLADAAVAAGVRKFVFSSTCATFGTPEALPLDESSPQHPINPYGESKLMLERVMQWYERIHGLSFVGLRYFNAAGATERFGEHHRVETHLIPNVLQVALGKKSHVEVYGTTNPTPDGTCVRDFVHVSDLVQAHLKAFDLPTSGFFNLGLGSGVSVREVVAACRKVSGREIPVRELPQRPGDPPRLVASSERARRVLGWSPRYTDLEEIVSTAWKWHLRHPEGYPD